MLTTKLSKLAYALTAAVALTLGAAEPVSAQFLPVLTPVTIVGTNPGNLSMFEYVPSTITRISPVVVVLHGCGQTAYSYDDETGWMKFAKAHNVSLIFAQQSVANNPGLCFNWFEPLDNRRDQGEAFSIRQMVSTFAGRHALQYDPSRVFVSGLSAGGAMAAVMLATYPELFKGGAVNAGVPYRCAEQVTTLPATATMADKGSECLKGLVNLTPGTWASLVPAYAGSKPRLITFHGDADGTVKFANMNELMEQWVTYTGVPMTATRTFDAAPRYPRDSYGPSAAPTVATVRLTGKGHAVGVDPGFASTQCGMAIPPFIMDFDICTTWYTGRFWNIW